MEAAAAVERHPVIYVRDVGILAVCQLLSLEVHIRVFVQDLEDAGRRSASKTCIARNTVGLTDHCAVHIDPYVLRGQISLDIGAAESAAVIKLNAVKIGFALVSLSVPEKVPYFFSFLDFVDGIAVIAPADGDGSVVRSMEVY